MQIVLSDGLRKLYKYQEEILKAVILAGGKGTRLSEETQFRPKPLVEAHGHPLIWHVMQNYARFGVSEFIVLAGHKGQQIREYFANYWLRQSDVTFDMNNPSVVIHESRNLPWKVTVLDTGSETETAGRIAAASHLLTSRFFLTYGDGVSDVDVSKLLDQHNRDGCEVTLTAVQPPARFGAIKIGDANQIVSFEEKPSGDGAWVNGGYFVVEPSIIKKIDGRNVSFESVVLPELAKEMKLNYFRHEGFWQPVDTLRDLQRLEEALSKSQFPWVN